ncbi:pyridoxal phosphate-dependent aminotransferase [Paenarthrobacter histidinolovorans]|uniref:pyridoxal phosphate-dependent aminotransferase n=1 Tax=Paenarthrobacter histidinolovorans TaxID=43664 RepID=UPI00166AE1F2|nr:pyridoxal phosphate-dependent aminotransferase [Paenarthrobacter histidinolovorans]GGJ40308.1 aminotransferase [Paenarthrobacter histidinolovorans]
MTKTSILPDPQTFSQAVNRLHRSSLRPASLGMTEPGSVALSMGEPDIGTPGAVVQAAISALKSGRTRYTAQSGLPELRRALAETYSERSGRIIQPEQVVITHGGSAGLAASVFAMVSPGDRVLIPEPTYSLYADQLAMAGADGIWISNHADGRLNLESLEREAPTARMIILCNPGNPTGRVYAADEMLALAAILEKNPHLLLLADEAYADIVYDGLPFLSSLCLHSIADQVIYSNTFSKSYAMTGWRVGFVVASPERAEAINLVHRSINGSLNTFVQDAALIALQTPEKDLAALTESYRERRDAVVDVLSRIPGVSLLKPQGAFYAFPKIATKLNSVQMAERFAANGVIVRAGSEYGPSGEGHVRISFATDMESLNEGMKRFAETVQAIA